MAIDETDVTFDPVAAGSAKQGTLLFGNDPSRCRLSVLPSGFAEPWACRIGTERDTIQSYRFI
jgi:uncharacterized protein (TIGR02588 family)